MSEYTEIIGARTTSEIAVNIAELLLTLPNVHKCDPAFNWNLIYYDVEDNKFVDCAITASADYIVTNDTHFDVLKKIDFPEVNTINADDFLIIARKLLKE